MKNKLQVQLRKDTYSRHSNEYEAQVDIKDVVDIDYVINQMILDGISNDKETILNILSRFNQKTAELVATGYQVDTELVSLRPVIKGLLYQKCWNPYINMPSVLISQSKMLIEALSETQVIINEVVVGLDETSKQETKESQNFYISEKSPIFHSKEEPACGMAFRTWLMKA